MVESTAEEAQTQTAKVAVRAFWDANPCGTHVATEPQSSIRYFEEIEAYRYAVEPEIFSFAQFSRFHGAKILEVGIGAGTDFVQWVRSGAKAHGVDLSPIAVELVRKRLAAYDLTAEDIRVADCESLPYPDDSFDLVYSWGVIMHSPCPERALREIVRVTRRGGRCKLMVYHRHSLGAFYLWVRNALLRGRPWRTFAWCLANYQESPGTRAFTRREFAVLAKELPVADVRVVTKRTYVDTLEQSAKAPVRLFGRIVSSICRSDRWGWFMLVEFQKR